MPNSPGVRHMQTADLQTADLQTCRLADLPTCRLADPVNPIRYVAGSLYLITETEHRDEPRGGGEGIFGIFV